jgi:teichoic acid transport system permease protein
LFAAIVGIVGIVVIGCFWRFDVFGAWYHAESGDRTPDWVYPVFMFVWLVVIWAGVQMAKRAKKYGELTLRGAFSEIVRDNWRWKGQAWHMAVTDLVKESRGAVLGWAWLLIKPAVYICVFWFGIVIGLKSGHDEGNTPYILWLSIGMIPWYFMQDMLTTGMNVYRRYPYLVNKIRFPLSVISTFFALSSFIAFLMSMAAILIIMVCCGIPLTIYAIQVPFIAVIMLVFFIAWSVMTAPLATLSKDFYSLVKALATPIFWMSGVLFDVAGVKSAVIRHILAFNPVTFFVTAFRDALSTKVWLWDKPDQVMPFIFIAVILFVLAFRSYSRLNREVADVL